MNRRQNAKESRPSALVLFDPFVAKYRFCFSLLPSSVGCYVTAVAEFAFLSAIFAYQFAAYFFQNPKNFDAAKITLGDGEKTLDSKNFTLEDFTTIGHQKSPALLIVLGLALILTLTFIVCLLVGVHKDNDKLVFAHLVFQVFRIISIVIVGIVLVFALIDEISREAPEKDQTFTLISIILCILVIGVEGWLFVIVLSFYRYAIDKSYFDVLENFDRGH